MEVRALFFWKFLCVRDDGGGVVSVTTPVGVSVATPVLEEVLCLEYQVLLVQMK
jgi:hypothetical protein